MITEQFLQVVAADEPLEQLIKQAVDAVDAEEGTLMMINPEQTALRFVMAISQFEHALEQLEQDLSKGISALSFQYQQPMIVNDVGADDLHDATVDQKVGSTTRTMMVCPVVSAEHEYGVLTAINKRSGGFSQADLEAYADHVVAICDRLAELEPVA